VRAMYRALAAAAGISILAACSSGQSAIEPPFTAVNVQSTTQLQFRVGTAHYANGAVYLNTLATYRQPTGLSGTLFNTPTITGPAGFAVPVNGTFTTSTGTGATSGTDGGTNHISATPPTQPGTPAVATTFNQTGGVFSYGFAPANSTTAGTANYAQISLGSAANNALYLDDLSTIVIGTPPGLVSDPVPGAKGNTDLNITAGAGGYTSVYTQPLYQSPRVRLPFLLGPPAVADFHNSNFPAGFKGYDSGFVMFAAAPVAGVYALHMTVPANTIGTLAATFDTTATLTTIAGLPAMVPPVITRTAGGGATFTVAAGPAGVTNQIIYVVDIRSTTGQPTHYAFNVPAAGGTFTLANNVGFNGATTFATGDSVDAWVVGADYDVVAGAPPANTAQTPTLPAQADISVSTVSEIVY